MKILSHYHRNCRSLSDSINAAVSSRINAAHTSSIGAATQGAEKPTAALWSLISWDTIKIDWTWHLDVEPGKRSSARGEFQPVTFSRLPLFADGRWPEINVTRASKLFWLRGTNGAKWSESTNASEALEIRWCAREQKLRQSGAAASDLDHNVPGIFRSTVYTVLDQWSNATLSWRKLWRCREQDLDEIRWSEWRLTTGNNKSRRVLSLYLK